MSDENVVQGDECSCDVCATGWHELSGAEKLARVLAEQDEKDVAHWRNYALSLEAENYDLQRENAALQEEIAEAEKAVEELEMQLGELDNELSAERARCSECGRHR